jgi:hypothetical protein
VQANEPQNLATQMREAPLEHLAAVIANTDPGSRASEAAKAELTRRDIMAAEGTVRWQKEAAIYTKANARWMFWSVVVVAVTSILNIVWQIWEHKQ